MEYQAAWLVLARGNPQSTVGLDPGDQRRQYISTSGSEAFSECQNCWESSRDRVSRRVPHRLVIEDMHRRSVQACRTDDRSSVAKIQRRCLFGSTEATDVLRDYSGGGLP